MLDMQIKYALITSTAAASEFLTLITHCELPMQREWTKISFYNKAQRFIYIQVHALNKKKHTVQQE